MPPGIPKIIHALGNVVANMTNPFTPLLLFNLILDTFTFLTLIVYPHIWIWVPGVILWIFTAVLYVYFAIRKSYMLSSTKIQQFGMKYLGDNTKPTFEENQVEIINIPNPDTEKTIPQKVSKK